MVTALGAVGKIGGPVSLDVAVSSAGELIARRYRLISLLGSGAMGLVWQARDERLDRTVAIKQLVAPASLSDIDSDAVNRRVMREGRITARLQHPHVIAVHDAVEHHGQLCLIMEYLPSRSLATVLAIHGVLAPEKVVAIGGQIASALAAAHQVGIVHRDIKPGNVLLADDGTAKITDFGVSHAVGDGTLTATGIFAGTPAYLAPEVARGDNARFPSDVFSLGSTLYTAVEGTPPFGLSDNPLALLQRVASGKIAPPRRSGSLTPLLLRLLERDPEHRATMHEARDALATLAADLAGSPGDLSAPTLPLSRCAPALEPVGKAQQTLSWPMAPEQPTSPSGPTQADASASRPQTEDEKKEGQVAVECQVEAEGPQWSGAHQLLIGAMTAVLLTASVLATMLVGRDTVRSDHATALASASTVAADSFQILPAQPGLSDPTPAAPAPVTADDPENIAEQPPTTIDYSTPRLGNPPAAGNRLVTPPPNYAGSTRRYQMQRPQRLQQPDQQWTRHQGWSGRHRHGHHRH